MKIPLTDFEILILNKVIHTQTFGEFHSLQRALHNLVEDEKITLISGNKVVAGEFPAFQSKVANDLQQFLIRNQFFSNRGEGDVYYLTEKGQYLQQQGTIQKYVDWELAREDKLISDLHTIEQRGYLDEDQTFKNEIHEKPPIPLAEEANKKNFGWYVLIIIVLIVVAAIGKSHKWW